MRKWGLSEEVELKIKHDYLSVYIEPEFPDATIEYVQMEKFYGVYGAGEKRTDDVIKFIIEKRGCPEKQSLF